jgi:hypothetical protein
MQLSYGYPVAGHSVYSEVLTVSNGCTVLTCTAMKRCFMSPSKQKLFNSATYHLRENTRAEQMKISLDQVDRNC